MRAVLLFLITSVLSTAAFAQQTYTFHENLHAGQCVTFHVVSDNKSNTVSTTNGVATPTNTETGQDWTVTLTTLDQKNGSAIRTRADVDPASVDTEKDDGTAEKKAACPYAGKSVILSRHPDETFSDDFTGSAGEDDTNMLDNFMTPDEDFYPDHPIAVGQTFDCSDKASRHFSLSPGDKMLAVGRLDWVKTIAGKQMAQFSVSIAAVYHEAGHVEEDMTAGMTLLIDIAGGMIVKSEETGSSKYSTAASEATQYTGGTSFTFHAERVATPTTQPN